MSLRRAIASLRVAGPPRMMHGPPCPDSPRGRSGHRQGRSKSAPRRASGLAIVLAAVALCGCRTPALDVSRYSFYRGDLAKAEATLADAKVPDIDRVLLLMERGLVRQAAGNYEDSSKDLIAAADLVEKLQTYSVSKGATSLVVNDGVQDFRGVPFERTFLHVFTAVNHLALANWDNGAVEARRIIKSLNPEVKGDYPEDAFSRYMAGFCLEMIGDDSNAALQYRNASKLMDTMMVSPGTGHLLPKPDTNAPVDDVYVVPGDSPWPNELICFVFIGRAPRGQESWNERWTPGRPLYAEIVHNGQVLGRSYNMADTMELAFTTTQIEAARKVAKTVGRVILKEVVAGAVEKQTDNAALGELVRFILIGLLEQPDVRRWETLPRWLQVARVPCPPGIESFDVVFKNAAGATIRTIHVTQPISRRGNKHVSFVRDLPTPPPAPAPHPSAK